MVSCFLFAFLGVFSQSWIEHDRKRESNDGEHEIKQHHMFVCLTSNILKNQKKRARSVPTIMGIIASLEKFGITNGITTDAIDTCPKSARILESVLVCSDDSMLSVYTTSKALSMFLSRRIRHECQIPRTFCGYGEPALVKSA